MIQRPIGERHTPECARREDYYRCDSCRRWGVPETDAWVADCTHDPVCDDRAVCDAKAPAPGWPWTGWRYGPNHLAHQGHPTRDET